MMSLTKHTLGRPSKLYDLSQYTISAECSYQYTDWYTHHCPFPVAYNRFDSVIITISDRLRLTEENGPQSDAVLDA